MQFINETQPRTTDFHHGHSAYGFDLPSKYLTVYGRLFQGVISQCGTYLVRGSFHESDWGIHKAEGGCNIVGAGWLVLCARFCYYDTHTKPHDERRDEETLMARLITHVVFRFDPMSPINSLIDAGMEIVWSEIAGAKLRVDIRSALRAALEKSNKRGNPFAGEALGVFFDNVKGHNHRAFFDELRDYRRYCMTEFDGLTHAEVDQKFADVDLGRELYDKLNEKYSRQYGYIVYSCSPERMHNGELKFWINCSKGTGIDAGWYSEAEIRHMLEGA